MTEAQYPVAGGAVLCCVCVGGGDVTFRRPGPGSARRITHWTRTIDHRRCLLLPVCPPSYRLPFFLFMSASPVLSATILLPLPSAPTSHLPPSASPLPIPFCFCSRLSNSVPLSMAALSPVRRPFSPPPPPPVALSVLRRHL